jgi:hypothetical protein
MNIAEKYSHLNGFEFLLVHKPELWKEIENVINAADAERCKTKASKERTVKGTLSYSPIGMNTLFKNKLSTYPREESGVRYWVTRDEKLIRKTVTKPPDLQKREIENQGEAAIRSGNQTDFVKNRAAVEVQLGKYAFVA